eukprot:10993209-Ditylum_brightwellii.AAC.1
MKKQVKRLRTAWCLLNALRLLPNTYSPRRRTKLRKIPGTGRSDQHEDFLKGWKLEFEKEGFDSSSSTLKEFLDVCVCLEEAELQKRLRKKIAFAEKEHNKDRKRKHQDRPKLHYKIHHSSGERH